MNNIPYTPNNSSEVLAFHTLSTNIHNEKPRLDDFELLVMIISALYWRKYNGDIELITDEAGRNFINNKGLSFIWNKILCVLDKYHKLNINENVFWAGSKIYALGLHKAPIVMIDLDFIVWKKIKFNKYHQDVITIHREMVNNSVYPNKEYFDMGINQSIFQNKFLDWDVEALNTAFAYFNNSKLIKQYCDDAMWFMKNVKIDKNKFALPYMVLAEQRLLSIIGADNGYSIGSFSDLDKLFNSEQNMFTHIWGHKQILRDDKEKRYNFCKDCVKRIRKDFPEAYERLFQYDWFRECEN